MIRPSLLVHGGRHPCHNDARLDKRLKKAIDKAMDNLFEPAVLFRARKISSM